MLKGNFDIKEKYEDIDECKDYCPTKCTFEYGGFRCQRMAGYHKALKIQKEKKWDMI